MNEGSLSMSPTCPTHANPSASHSHHPSNTLNKSQSRTIPTFEVIKSSSFHPNSSSGYPALSTTIAREIRIARRRILKQANIMKNKLLPDLISHSAHLEFILEEASRPRTSIGITNYLNDKQSLQEGNHLEFESLDNFSAAQNINILSNIRPKTSSSDRRYNEMAEIYLPSNNADNEKSKPSKRVWSVYSKLESTSSEKFNDLMLNDSLFSSVTNDKTYNQILVDAARPSTAPAMKSNPASLLSASSRAKSSLKLVDMATRKPALLPIVVKGTQSKMESESSSCQVASRSIEIGYSKWKDLVDELHRVGENIATSDLLELLSLRAPNSNIIAIIGYLGVLFGVEPEWKTLRGVVLQDVTALKTFLKTIDPLEIPSSRMHEVDKYFMSKLSPLIDLSRPANSLVCTINMVLRWVFSFHSLIRLYFVANNARKNVSKSAIAKASRGRLATQTFDTIEDDAVESALRQQQQYLNKDDTSSTRRNSLQSISSTQLNTPHNISSPTHKQSQTLTSGESRRGSFSMNHRGSFSMLPQLNESSFLTHISEPVSISHNVEAFLALHRSDSSKNLNHRSESSLSIRRDSFASISHIEPSNPKTKPEQPARPPINHMLRQSSISFDDLIDMLVGSENSSKAGKAHNKDTGDALTSEDDSNHEWFYMFLRWKLDHHHRDLTALITKFVIPLTTIQSKQAPNPVKVNDTIAPPSSKGAKVLALPIANVRTNSVNIA